MNRKSKPLIFHAKRPWIGEIIMRLFLAYLVLPILWGYYTYQYTHVYITDFFSYGVLHSAQEVMTGSLPLWLAIILNILAIWYLYKTLRAVYMFIFRPVLVTVGQDGIGFDNIYIAWSDVQEVYVDYNHGLSVIPLDYKKIFYQQNVLGRLSCIFYRCMRRFYATAGYPVLFFISSKRLAVPLPYLVQTVQRFYRGLFYGFTQL